MGSTEWGLRVVAWWIRTANAGPLTIVASGVMTTIVKRRLKDPIGISLRKDVSATWITENAGSLRPY
jgi:hypothetical protein